MLRMTIIQKKERLTTYNKGSEEIADGHYYILNKQSFVLVGAGTRGQTSCDARERLAFYCWLFLLQSSLCLL